MLDLELSHRLRPAAPDTAQPWLLVLMHGVGSNEEDLFALSPYLPAGLHVLSLRAPHVLGPGSYAWFEFGVGPDGRRVIQADQERDSRARLTRVIESAARQLGVPAARVVVGGFSQGGIMGLSLLLTQPQLMHGTLVMHSRLLPEALADQVAPERMAGRQVWVSWGTEDAVLPPSFTQGIVEHLRPLPVELDGAGFAGGHTIGAQELGSVVAWLGRLMTGAPLQA